MRHLLESFFHRRHVFVFFLFGEWLRNLLRTRLRERGSLRIGGSRRSVQVVLGQKKKRKEKSHKLVGLILYSSNLNVHVHFFTAIEIVFLFFSFLSEGLSTGMVRLVQYCFFAPLLE